METNTTPTAKELGTDETAKSETTTNENAVAEDAKPKSIWRKIEDDGLDFTDALETSQGVIVRNRLVFSDTNFSLSMVFVPAVKIVELHDGSLTIK